MSESPWCESSWAKGLCRRVESVHHCRWWTVVNCRAECGREAGRKLRCSVQSQRLRGSTLFGLRHGCSALVSAPHKHSGTSDTAARRLGDSPAWPDVYTPGEHPLRSADEDSVHSLQLGFWLVPELPIAVINLDRRGQTSTTRGLLPVRAVQSTNRQPHGAQRLLFLSIIQDVKHRRSRSRWTRSIVDDF